MQTDVDHLLLIIGRKTVEIELMQIHINALQAQVEGQVETIKRQAEKLSGLVPTTEKTQE